MNLLAPVSEIMTTDLITLDANDSFRQLEEVFQSNRIHHLPVLEEERLVGIISKSDYLFYKKGNIGDNVILDNNQTVKINDLKARHIMTRGLAKLEPTDRINIALEIFKENIFHAILIVEGEKLKGIVSTYDIILHLANDKEAGQKYLFN